MTSPASQPVFKADRKTGFQRYRGLVFAAAMAAMALQGCSGGGGGGSSSTPPPPILQGGSLPVSYQGPSPQAAGTLYYTVSRATNPGNDPAGVRIGIDDDVVDFRHSTLRNRIGFKGASFSYRRPLITDGSEPDELEACKDGEPCRVYLVNSGGNRSKLESLARTVLQEHGFPDDEPWYLYDIADGGFGWSRLPTPDADAGLGLSHGTRVARVAVAQAPQSIIVPMARDFDQQLMLTLTISDVNPSVSLAISGDPFLGDIYLAHESSSKEIFDKALAKDIKERHESVDIINSSYSIPVDTTGEPDKVTEYMDNLGNLRTYLPNRWAAYTQNGTDAGERTIRVWAAGNSRDDLGNEARSMNALEVYYFPDLRGHTVVATGLDSNDTALADYANFCGDLPSDWVADDHGRHYCLAAPGSHFLSDPVSNLTYRVDGTSFAAPYVSGVLARMMAKSRGQVGNTELVKRLMNTANNTAPFNNSFYYGAGVVNPTAALNAVGTMATGLQGNQAPLQSTSMRMPAAYGDAARRVQGMEVASFDAWNFPFWTRTGDLIRNGRHPMDPIPSFTGQDEVATCFMAQGYVPQASCAPWAEAGPVSMLVAGDGLGAGLRLSDGIAVAGFTRNAGRLDGRASGAFSFDAGSSLAAVHFTRDDALDLGDGWSLDARITLALDTPRGIGRSKVSMFQAGTALLSSWQFGLAREGGAGLTRLAVSQPPRAESGTGRLTIPVGRRLDGSHIHETRTFSLQPSRRTLTTSLVHRRPLAGGDAVVSLQHTANPGHAPNAPVYGAGIAWRLSF